MANVLYVDDDRMLRELASRWLGDNYSVKVAESGEQALEMLASDEENPDVVVTDHDMLRISGSSLVREIKNKYRNIKCIGISGGGSGNKGLFEQAGADAYLSKPFDGDELCQTIGKLLQR